MPLDPKAITPRDVRASGSLPKLAENAEAGPPESVRRTRELSSIVAEKTKRASQEVEKSRRNREMKRQARQTNWCASPRTGASANTGAATRGRAPPASELKEEEERLMVELVELDNQGRQPGVQTTGKAPARGWNL